MTDPRSLPDTATPAEHALHWAQWADDRETDRSIEQRHVEQVINDQKPGWTVRAEEHQDAFNTALKERDLGITMANMWAAVAAVQPAPAPQAPGQCPILVDHPEAGWLACGIPAGHTGVHRNDPEHVDGFLAMWADTSDGTRDIREQQ